MAASIRRRVAGGVAGVVAGAALPCAWAALGLGGLDIRATCVLGILLGAIVWWVVGVMPEYVTALLMAMLFVAVAGVPTEVVFSTFSGATWWLLLAAFGLGLGMQKSGLLRRMARGVLRVFPRTFAAQAAGLIAAGTLVGPLIPSLSAKAAMLAPLSMSISDSMGYERKGKQATGLFLAMFTGLRTVGPAVISASIIGYGLVALLPADVQQRFDMLHWLFGMLPWFVVVTVLNFAAILTLYGPRGTRGRAGAGSAAGVGEAGEDGAPRGGRAAADSEVVGVCEAAGACEVAGATGAHDARKGSLQADGAPRDEAPTPFSAAERRMLVIIVCCVAMWVAEPFTHVAAHVVALCALVVMLAAGVVSKADFKSGIAWDSLIFIGIVLGLASVLAYVGVDVWIVSLCQPMLSSLAQNPYLLVAGIGLITVLMRFVIVSEMAYINLFMAFMVPLAISLGVSPWVVGVTVYAMVNPWFALYQNSIYLTAYYAVDAQMVRHGDAARYCAVYLAICLIGLLCSVPWWQWMGLL